MTVRFWPLEVVGLAIHSMAGIAPKRIDAATTPGCLVDEPYLAFHEYPHPEKP